MSTAHEPHDDVLGAALDAWHAGLSVVPVRADGSKRPAGEWKHYQTDRATREQVAVWFTDGGHVGFGVICGAVSGDLEMLELEGRFMAEHGAEAFKDAMRAAGLALLLSRLINGFMVVSPSNGRHFYYRVDGEAAPNTKLARRHAADGEAGPQVLIETRGEGGFVVAPPSGGTVHPTGRPWRTKAGTYAAIPTITTAERDALFAVCRTFDTAGHDPARPAEPVAPEQRARITAATRTFGAASWMDALVDHLRATMPMTALLEHYGWTHAYTDRHGRHLMTRPGKDHGVSGSVNTNGRFLPFSTSVPFDTGRIPPTTYDQLDVIAAYEHASDRQAAARAVAERIGLIGPPRATQPPPGVDPDTGEIIGRPNMGEAFWTARPVLEHIRHAARARLVAPPAVLGAVLARVAAFTPPSTCLPPTVGATAPLSTYVAFRGRSGAGKSTPAAVAADLLPDTPAGCVGPLSLGSGEGLVEAFMELVEETDPGGKKRKIKRQIRHGALFMLDEGQMLAEISNRRGSTILPTLRTAWSGGDPGQANASIETRRSLRPGSYSIGLISLWQDKAAAILLADVDGGTPQRFVWLPTDDPEAGEHHDGWPGPLDWTPPAAITVGDRHQAYPLELDDTITDEVRSARIRELRGDVDIDPLDSHRRLCKLKVAGVLAVLDGRHHVTTDDWWLAECIMATSDGIRSWVLAEAARRADSAVEGAARRAAKHAEIVEETAATRALLSAAKAVHRAAVRAAPEPVGRRQVHSAIASRDRQHVTTDDAIAEAERLRWVAATALGDAWTVGDATPK